MTRLDTIALRRRGLLVGCDIVPRKRRMTRSAGAKIFVRPILFVTRLAGRRLGRVLETKLRMARKTRSGAMLAREQLRVIGVLTVSNGLPVIDVVTGVAGRTGSAVLLLVAIGAGDFCD